MVSKLKQEIAKWAQGSEIGIGAQMLEGKAQRVVIELRGPIANIPSLKNSKLPGKNFLNLSVLSRLKVMDACFKQTIAEMGNPDISFGADEVTCLVVCAKRKVSFDTDNVLATVRDWLEYPVKKVGKGRDRGWGIGLVDNDRQIKGLAVYCKDLGVIMEQSLIIIQRYALKKLEFQQFLETYFMEGVGASILGSQQSVLRESLREQTERRKENGDGN